MKGFANRSSRIKRAKGTTTEVICIQGTERGVGTTHFAISLGNYLASKERFRVGIIELDEVSKLAGMMDGDMMVNVGCVGFTKMNVDYYPKANWDNVRALREIWYDYLLLVFPPASAGLDFPKEYHRQIAVGSLKPWCYHDYQRFMRDYYFTEGMRKWDLYGLFLKKEEQRKFEQEFQVSMRSIPFIEDPFCLRKNDLLFLSSVLASWQE